MLGGIKDLSQKEPPNLWMVKLSPKFPKMHEIKEIYKSMSFEGAPGVPLLRSASACADILVTARKRSFGPRYCSYTCLSVHREVSV